MSTTLTVRTGPELRRALETHAKSAGKTVSEFVREILEEAVAERPMAERTAHVRGRVELPERAEEWRRQIKERNWRP
jgi:hypothetical protein